MSGPDPKNRKPDPDSLDAETDALLDSLDESEHDFEPARSASDDALGAATDAPAEPPLIEKPAAKPAQPRPKGKPPLPSKKPPLPSKKPPLPSKKPPLPSKKPPLPSKKPLLPSKDQVTDKPRMPRPASAPRHAAPPPRPAAPSDSKNGGEAGELEARPRLDEPEAHPALGAPPDEAARAAVPPPPEVSATVPSAPRPAPATDPALVAEPEPEANLGEAQSPEGDADDLDDDDDAPTLVPPEPVEPLPGREPESLDPSAVVEQKKDSLGEEDVGQWAVEDDGDENDVFEESILDADAEDLSIEEISSAITELAEGPEDTDSEVDVAAEPMSLEELGLAATDLEEDGALPEVALDFSEEHPAASHLAQRDLTATWLDRAEWFETEARASEDPAQKGRALTVASELRAMAGDMIRARLAAKNAAQSAPSLGLALKQARQLAALDEDWKTATSLLDAESRSAPTAEARTHAAYLCAEIHRLALDDPDTARRKRDQAFRANAEDPRPFVMRLGEQLASGAQAPSMPIPESADFTQLVEAVTGIVQLRGRQPPGDGTEPTPALAFELASGALSAGDVAGASRFVAALSSVDGLETGSIWLAAALCAPHEQSRGESVTHLKKLLDKTPSPRVRRALAARALEQGDADAAARALSEGDESEPAFSAADRVALGALSGGQSQSYVQALEELARDDAQRLVAAAAAHATDSLDLSVSDGPDDQLVSVGRRLARSPADPADAIELCRDPTLSRVLAAEHAVCTRAFRPLIGLLSEWPDPVAGPGAAALLSEITGDTESAGPLYERLSESETFAELSARVITAISGEARAAEVLERAARREPGSPTRSALLLFETAARRQADPVIALELAARAAELSPELPFPARLSAHLSRLTGDAAGLVRWLEHQRNASPDAVERALYAIRQALLTADEDLGRALGLLGEAIAARPADLTLRELYERLSPGPSAERGHWRLEVAGEVDPATRTRLLIEAALELERAGALADAAQAAASAAESGNPFAVITGARLERHLADLGPLAERLLALAKAADDAEVQRELYERLSEVDRARGDFSSALMWQRLILEQSPHHWPALRRLEHEYIGKGVFEALESPATALCRLPDPLESMGHLRLAVRLMLARDDAEAAEPLVRQAAAAEPPPLWALRELAALARQRGDDETLLSVRAQLAERVPRSVDRSELLLGAGRAAARLGKLDSAVELLNAALQTTPDHFVALQRRAAIHERAGNPAAAAEDWEQLARLSSVAEHQLRAWHRAASLFLDEAGDQDRGAAALEKAAALDVANDEVFDRLQLLYVQRGQRDKLAHLLERRLERASDPEERVSLEVVRGRALADLGDHQGARQALNAALEANPDHTDALDVYANLCVAEKDWTNAEQAWLRLARVIREPERQAEIYRRLAELYSSDLVNLERAEVCYGEVLKRQPNDVDATASLVRVRARLGKTEEALQMQNALIERAGSAEEKRDRTIGLAYVYEQGAKDPKRALETLEKARKVAPYDDVIVRALAEHHQRQGNAAAAKVLIDRAAADARRALSHGRFDAAFFAMLTTVAELRGGHDAARVARATLAGLEGRESKLEGAGSAAGARALDDLLAPDLVVFALRTLLAKLPGILDEAYPMDLRALKAAPLPHEANEAAAEIRQIAESLGIRELEVLATSELGATCVAASSAPPRIVVGQQLLDAAAPAPRYFSIFRTLKTIQAHVSGLTRIAPIDLGAVVAALVTVFAPSFQPQGVDAKKLATARHRLETALPPQIDDDIPTLALEAAGGIGNRASQLGTGVNQWGNRAALLAVGDVGAGFEALSLMHERSKQLPASGPERLKWIMRHAEARDIAVFSVSEAYAEARRQLLKGER